MVNVPKEKKTFCKSEKCRKHTVHKVTQYKAGKASGFAQGKRRYDRKQQGYGGQTKPVFHKKASFFASCSLCLFLPCVSVAASSSSLILLQAKTTKKVTLRLECKECKYKMQLPLKRTKHFEIGANKYVFLRIVCFRLCSVTASIHCHISSLWCPQEQVKLSRSALDKLPLS
jgi:large subunit ribosomal protein L44e